MKSTHSKAPHSPARPRSALAALASFAAAALAAALMVPGCAAEPEGGGTSEPSASVSSAFSVHGCKCTQTGSCSKMSFTDIPADSTYIVTTFTGGTMGCGGVADGKWAYIADAGRFGCGAKVKIEANGKSCVAKVADCGPNRCVEEAAANINNPSGTCGTHTPIVDASPFITGYLFGTKSAGYSDKIKVKVTQADSSAPVGCPGGAPSTPTDDNQEDACQSDSDCNHNTPGQAVVCNPSAGGAGKPACVDGCRKAEDCPSDETCSSPDGKSIGSCSGQMTKLGTSCKSDADCNGGSQGDGRVCSDDKKCVVGCHSDSDCPGAATNGNTHCDHSLTPWTCVTRKNLGDSCSSDKDCNGGVGGTQRVCNNQKVCDDACHSDADCQSSERCDKTQPTWKCQHVVAAGVSDSCVISYPSGVAIQGIKTPASVKQQYSARGCSLPFTCMIDVRNIKDANTGKTLSYNHIKLSEHFSLRDLTATSAARSPYVYVDPELITHLELTRNSYAKFITINSGFRSAAHQAATCQSMCGKATCSKNGHTTCALCSRHMAGTAADVQHSSPKCALAGKACNPGKFDFIYNEKAGGDHLHVEMKAKHPNHCIFQDISCN